MTSARDEVLSRVRHANGLTPRTVDVQRSYRTAGEHQPGGFAVVALLEDRLVDYRAAVRRTDDQGLPQAIAAALAEAGAGGGPVLMPSGLPRNLLPEGQPDHPDIGARELDGFAAVVTACVVACAETGTIVLDGSPDQGRRAITLVPDVHVCIVRDDQVVQTVPEMLARCDSTRPITFVSGPSATSDIELDRVEGVHGPRTLSVVLVARRSRDPED